jgi:hypothetical protein
MQARSIVPVLLLTLAACDRGRSGQQGPGTDGGTGGDMVFVAKPSGASCNVTAADNPTSSGTDFFVTVPYVDLVGGACFAVYLANTSDVPVTVGVEHGASSLDPQTFGYIPSGSGQGLAYAPLTGATIPAGEVAVLFLNRGPSGFPLPAGNYDCPAGITPAITATNAAVQGTGRGPTFHVTTSAAVAAYDMYPFGGGRSEVTSATLLLPSSAYDTNYLAVDAIGAAAPAQSFWTQIVAKEDGTQVTIRPSNAIVGGNGVDAADKGVPHTYVVNRGEVLQFVQDVPLVGSVIQSTAPIGVWGGKGTLGIDGCCLDSAHQQLPPLRAWGSEYAGVRYRDRYANKPESPPWRIIGAVDGTQLTWEPSTPAGAPATLMAGSVFEFRAGDTPFVVRSQDKDHPFYLAGHMGGSENFDPGNDGRGDAEWVNTVPTGEYASSYVFFTDPTYSETHLVLVRQRCDNAYADVVLDCSGPITAWQPIADGMYEYARVDLVTGNFAGQNGCDNGRHEISSARPFGITVWGWGSGATGAFGSGFYTQYTSYAYPAGANLDPINDVVITP